MAARVGLLTHPMFAGAVCLLAFNDRLLKERWPGIVTGKLSDVAGVVVLALLLHVAVGRRGALVLTVAGFTALKTLPPAAAAVAPVLGGLTRTDASDLVALIALVPLSRWLLEREQRTPLKLRGIARTTLASAAFFASLLATTATSCAQMPSIVDVAASPDGMWAMDASGTDYRSLDRGRTWTKTETAPARDGATEACIVTSCWSVVRNEAVFSCVDGICGRAFSFSGDERRRMEDAAPCGRVGDDFLAVATAAPTDEAPFVVVAMGEQGVLVGTTDGEWTRRAVGRSVPLPIDGWPGWLLRAALITAIVGLVAAPVFLFARRHPLAGAAAALSMIVVIGLALVIALGDRDKAGVVTLVGSGMVLVASIGIGWRRGVDDSPGSVGVPGRPEWPPPPGSS